jgi:polysaccharide biosynthesis PFTS motif protein
MKISTKPFIALFLSRTNYTHSFINNGYEKMLKTNDLYKIRRIIELICEAEYRNSKTLSKIALFTNVDNVGLSLFTSQRHTSYLLTAFSFNRAISTYFLGAGNLVYPLKKEWQEIFLSHGVKVSKVTCSLLWKGYLILMGLKELAAYLNRVLRIIKCNFNNRIEKVDLNVDFLSVYFFDISKRNMPTFATQVFEKNLVTWYKKIVLSDSKINVVHNVKDFVPSTNNNSGYKFNYFEDLFASPKTSSEAKNLIWWFKLILNKSINLNTRINLILNLNEIMKAKFVNDNISDIKLHSVVFNNSIGSIKPLWSIILEENSVEINYCFYACYAEPLDLDGNLPIDGFWKLANWKNIYVVDQYQKLQLEDQIIFNSTIIVPSVIPWWTDRSLILPISEKKTICLFDTILHSNLYTLGTLNQIGWYKADIAIEYLSTVLEVASELDMLVLYKFKRMREESIRNKTHWNAVLKLTALYQDIIVKIDDSVSSERLILASTVTVSKPLSTTALIAKSVSKPSLYYDPTKKISQFDPALRGIPILNKKQDLLDTMKNILINDSRRD